MRATRTDTIKENETQMNQVRMVFGMAAALLTTGAILAAQPVWSGPSCCGPQAMAPAAQPVQARHDNGVQKATVVIDGGYRPAVVTVKAGRPVQLTFVRREKSGCGNVVRFPGLNIERTLKTGQKTVVAFTPKKAGAVAFTCGMGMYKGQVVAK